MGVIDLELAESLARHTFDVVTAEALDKAGLCTRWASRQARRGHWQSPARRTYVVHARPLSDLTFGHAAAAHAGPEAVITGLIPLRILGLRWLPALTWGSSIGTDVVGPSIVPIEPQEGSASKDASASRGPSVHLLHALCN